VGQECYVDGVEGEKGTMTTPKVSVCVVTYNHVKYIRECLESLANQETDFEFEIIVGEDASTDGTRAVVQEFADRHPGLIIPILHEKNVGARTNYLMTHGAARGRYIAHLDGDDHALPGKLQAQADFLDAHPGVNIVWHSMRVLDAKSLGTRTYSLPRGLQPTGGFRRGDLLAIGSVGFHSAKMYRTECRKNLQIDTDVLDHYVDVKHIGEGRAAWIDAVLGVYRANVGISSNGLKTRKLLIENLMQLAEEHPEHRPRISSHAMRLFVGDLLNRRSTLPQSSRLAGRTLSARGLAEFVWTTLMLKLGQPR